MTASGGVMNRWPPILCSFSVSWNVILVQRSTEDSNIPWSQWGSGFCFTGMTPETDSDCNIGNAGRDNHMETKHCRPECFDLYFNSTF